MLDHGVSLLHRPKYLRQLANPSSITTSTDNIQTPSSSLSSNTLIKAMNKYESFAFSFR